MNKLIAAAAIVIALLAAGSSAPQAAEVDLANLKCGPAPVIQDPELLSELEGKSELLKGLAAKGADEGFDAFEKLQNVYRDRPGDVWTLAGKKLRHMMCMLAKDPESGLSADERQVLGEIKSTWRAIPICGTSCSYDPNVRLTPLLGPARDCETRTGEAAIRACDEALRQDPRNAWFYFLRGWHHTAGNDLERALADYDQGLALSPSTAAYNDRCWVRAALGRELVLALTDCDEALRRAPRKADYMDSRGFAYLRLGRLDDAIADYDAALTINPKLVASLYGRGLAKHGKGDAAGADADIAAATALQADVAETFAKYGVTR